MTVDVQDTCRPAVVDGMPPAQYLRHPALSASGAKRLLPPSTPAHYRWWADHPEPPKAEFDFGHAVHSQVLGVGDPVDVIDAPDWRTKAAKDAKAAAYAAGHVPVLAKDWAAVRAMVTALRAHPVAGPLFEAGTGQAELSLFWHDPEFGIDRRSRLDWFKGRLVVDFKTCVSAAPAAAAKAMVDFDYHGQLDFYLDAVVACGLHDQPAGLLVMQEKAPPHLIGIYEPDPLALAAGRLRNRRAMDTFARCVAADHWPGYPVGPQPLAMPRWAEVAHDAAVFRGDYDTEAD